METLNKLHYDCNPLYERAMESIVQLEIYEDVKFEFSDWWKAGLMVASIAKGTVSKDINLVSSLQRKCKHLCNYHKLKYDGTLNPVSKTRYTIELRDKKKKFKWPDVRTTLPYIWYDHESDPQDIHFTLFDSAKKDLAHYCKPPFFVLGDGATVDFMEPLRFKIHKDLATLFHLPEMFVSAPQYLKMYKTVNNIESLLAEHQWTYQSFIDLASAASWINAIGEGLGNPHKLEAVVADKKLKFTISNELRLVLPHAFARFPLESVTEDGQWAAKIYYFDEESMGKLGKSFTVPFKKTYATQVTALQTSATQAFAEIATGIDAKEAKKDGDAKTELTFKINRTRNSAIKSIDIADGYELELHQGLAAYLKIKKNIFSADANDYAWVTSDIVGETMIGETSMRLLAPTPLQVTTAKITNKEYMPVNVQRFSMIEIKMHTNPKTMELYDAPYNILFVLHFVPRYKRKGHVTDDDTDRKKHCPDGCSSRLL